MFRTMFLQEGKIASLLTHANIVQVNDFGEDGGRFYICMELVEGRNVAALVEQCREGREQLAPRFAA
jgi:eukaryotic-like serine/threonine-protein kinase